MTFIAHVPKVISVSQGSKRRYYRSDCSRYAEETYTACQSYPTLRTFNKNEMSWERQAGRQYASRDYKEDGRKSARNL